MWAMCSVPGGEPRLPREVEDDAEPEDRGHRGDEETLDELAGACVPEMRASHSALAPLRSSPRRPPPPAPRPPPP